MQLWLSFLQKAPFASRHSPGFSPIRHCFSQGVCQITGPLSPLSRFCHTGSCLNTGRQQQQQHQQRKQQQELQSTIMTMNTPHYRILGGTADLSPSIFLFCEDKRYLFNCGEGIQRFCMSHRIRMKQISGIFMTQASWDCIGGIPGALLTIKDSAQRSDPVALYGPKNLGSMLYGTTSFMHHRAGLFDSVTEILAGEEEISDGRTTIKAFVIRAKPLDVGTALTYSEAAKRHTSFPDVLDDISFSNPYFESLSASTYEDTGRLFDHGSQTQVSSELLDRFVGKNGSPRRKRDKAFDMHAQAHTCAFPVDDDGSLKEGVTAAKDSKESGHTKAALRPPRPSSPSARERGRDRRNSNGSSGNGNTPEANTSGTQVPRFRKSPPRPKWRKGNSKGKARKPIRVPTKDEVLANAQEVNTTVVCYVGQVLHDRKGKFNVKKALEKKVPRGALWAALTRGDSVTLEDNTVVHPEDVLDPLPPHPPFAIIYVPTAEILQAFLDRDDFFATFAALRDQSAVAFHIVPEPLRRLPQYDELLERLGPGVDNIFTSSGSSHHSAYTPSVKLQYMLQSISPAMFASATDCLGDTSAEQGRQHTVLASNNHASHGIGAPDFYVPPPPFPSSATIHGIPLSMYSRAGKKSTLMKYSEEHALQPVARDSCIASAQQLLEKHLAKDASPLLLPADQQKTQGDLGEIAKGENLSHVEEGSGKSVNVAPRTTSSDDSNCSTTTSHGSSSTSSSSDRFLHFFGTGSAIPSNLRNVTSMLVGRGISVSESTGELVMSDWVDGDSTTRRAPAAMLLDCGEGTYGQMVRKFGKDGVAKVLRSIRLVHISHMHADHHLGTTRVLKKRKEAFEAAGLPVVPAVVIGPRFLWTFMRHTLHLSMDNSVYIDAANLCQADSRPFPALVPQSVLSSYSEALDALGLVSLHLPKVKHCMEAYGFVSDFKDGFRFVWSGDTRPCAALVAAGKGADVLVHEATFESELVDQAIAKKHSTLGEAYAVAEQMQARSLLLTHFSQRYKEAISQGKRRTACAFDLMSVNLDNLDAIVDVNTKVTVLFDAMAAHEEEQS